MARIFLNELTEGDRQVAEPEAGKWKRDENFLEKFAHDIQIRGQLDDGISNSVPSVFARPIQFWQALGGESHPMHDKVVAQWRGLLALFALQKALQIPLRLVRYSIRDNPQESDLDRRFVQILASQRPRPVEEWSSWLLIYCNDRLVGATSPWTMVYTPSTYGKSPGVQWADADGRLGDPASSLYDDSDGATNDELRVLLTWVDLLLAGHPWGMTTEQEQRSRVLARELRKWRNELVRRVQPLEGETKVVVTSSQATSFYKYFLSSADVPIKDTSEFVLADDDGCGTIVLSRTALRNPIFRKRRVHGGIRVEDLDLSSRALPGPAGPGGWTTKTGSTVNRPYLVAEEYFLSDRLLAIPVRASAWRVGTGDYVLPLRPAFFKHFKPGALGKKIVSLEPSPEGVMVRLNLPLQNGTTLQVERLYHENEIEHLVERQEVPALAIWPDFYDPQWKDYEALLVDAGAKNGRLRYQPILEGGTTGPGVGLTEEDPELAVWRTKLPVIGFGIEVTEPGKPPAAAGVVIRRSVSQLDLSGGAWDVGIDFGTSNTQIKRRTADGESPLILKAHTLVLTGDEGTTADQLARTHPREESRPPFATLLMKESYLNPDTGKRDTVSIIPLNLDVVSLASDFGNFVRDVKWDAEGDTQQRYLERLVRLLSAEARAAGVTRLNLRWSFPLSLPERILSTMERFWASAGYPSPGERFEVTAEVRASESDALSRYVSAKDVLPIAASCLSIGVDIGGGSTDIAFWSAQTLIDRVSLNVAGNDIIRLAAAFPELNIAVASPLVGAALASSDLLARGFKARPEILWNYLLTPRDRPSSPHSHPFVAGMHKTSSDPWRKTRTGAFLGAGGLFFYLGIHAGLYVTPATDQVAIYVGGGGSAILAWLAPAKPLRELLIQLFLQGLALVQPDAKPDVEIVGTVVGMGQKTVLKDEVASGLLEREELTAMIKAGFTGKTATLGEAHWSDPQGKELPWQTQLSVEQLSTLGPPANHSSSYISYFLTRVARPLAEKFALDAPGLGNLQLSQNWAINDLRKGKDEYSLQPIFAYELKSLLRRYAQAVGQVEVPPTDQSPA